MTNPVAVVINPMAGPAWRRRTPAECEATARRVLVSLEVEAWIGISQGPGHPRELARQALAAGAEIVIAWGGDGTVNEVASALIDGRGSLGIVPAGSGNGLARDLRVPRPADRAIAAAVSGGMRWIDAGELNGRLFFNVAGVGFDAHVAHAFATTTRRARGLASYLAITWEQLFAYQSAAYHVIADGADQGIRHALLVSIANTCQWGNGARIAPCARPDDGQLDLVIVDARAPRQVLAHSWRLFNGSIAAMPGVANPAGPRGRVDGDTRCTGAVDGEPLPAAPSIEVRVRPHALRVRVPDSRTSGK